MLVLYKIGEIIYKTLQIENAQNKIFYSFRTTNKDREQMKNNDFNIIIGQENIINLQSKPSYKKIEDVINTIEEEEKKQAFIINEYSQQQIQTIKITILTYKNNVNKQNDIATELASKIALIMQSQVSQNLQDLYKFRIISNSFNYNDISLAEGIESEIERIELSFKILYKTTFNLKEEIITEFENNFEKIS